MQFECLVVYEQSRSRGYVSATSKREALNRLQTEGLISNLTQQARYVWTFDVADQSIMAVELRLRSARIPYRKDVQ